MLLHDTQHRFAPAPESVIHARRIIEELPITNGRLVQAKLLVSELVRNSIEHAGLGAADEIEVRAHIDDGGTVHVEVTDAGPGPRPNHGRGVGWRTLERVADRWGVVRSSGRACVWFELDAPRR